METQRRPCQRFKKKYIHLQLMATIIKLTYSMVIGTLDTFRAAERWFAFGRVILKHCNVFGRSFLISRDAVFLSMHFLSHFDRLGLSMNSTFPRV